MMTFLQDVRYTLRVLRKAPGFTAVAVFVLALGIGVNTTIFSIVNAMLLRPLGGSDGLVGVFTRDPAHPGSFRAFSYPEYQDIRESREIFAGAIAQSFTTVGLTEGGDTRRVFAAVVSANYFSTLDARITQGRGFLQEEEDAAAPAAVVVSHEYWRKHGGDAGLVNGTVRINGRDFTVVGVAPEGFTGTLAMLSPELWLPIGAYDTVADERLALGGGRLADRTHRSLSLAVRLKPGLTSESAEPLLSALSARMAAAHPVENGNHTLMLHPLARLNASAAPSDDGEVTTVMVFLLGMSGIVLVIACLNLANMMLARGSARRREIAIRLAVGGNRFHIVRQLLTEALTLSLVGGAVGLVVAVAGTTLLTTSLLPVLPLVLDFDPTPDARVLAATVLFSLMSTLLFGLGPALRLSRASVVPELKEQPGDAGRSGLGRRFSMRNVLVVGQVALSLALLTAGGLFVRGALAAASSDAGFSLDRQLVVATDASLGGYDEGRARYAYRTVIGRLRAMPEVERASMASSVPFSEFSSNRAVRPVGASTEEQYPTYGVIGAGYFETLGLRMLRGREFTGAEEEAPSSLRPVIVDEPLARRLWKNEDPLGQQLQVKVEGRDEWSLSMQVVGVAPAIKDNLLDKDAYPHVYVPFGGHYASGMHLHVRTRRGGDSAEAAALQAVRQEVRAVDPNLPVVGTRTLRQQRDGSLHLWIAKTAANVFCSFGVAALLLAVVGIYGVKAYVVARRTREIGIRMAIGATPADVLRLILGEGVALTAVGLGIGLLLAALIASMLQSWVFGVSAFDPVVFLVTPVLLAGSSLVACYVPARRAMKVAPVVALRRE